MRRSRGRAHASELAGHGVVRIDPESTAFARWQVAIALLAAVSLSTQCYQLSFPEAFVLSSKLSAGRAL